MKEDFKNEKQLQAACVRWFSENYPELRGLLFATFNETHGLTSAQKKLLNEIVNTGPRFAGRITRVFNRKAGMYQTMQRKALGHVRGVSDLIFLAENVCRHTSFQCFKTIFIEVKLKGNSHKREHIQSQLEWGKKLPADTYYIINSLDGFKWIINWFINSTVLKDGKDGIYDIEKIEELLCSDKKTITF